MDDSFRGVLKYLEFHGPDPADIRLFIISISIYVALIVATVLINSLVRRRRERNALIKSARTHGLSGNEMELISALAQKRSKVDVKQVFSSIREFHRLFGPMMHDLVSQSERDLAARKKLDGIFALRKKLFGDVSYHFGSLTSTVQLRIGLRLTLRFEYSSKIHTFNSVILDVDSEAITVANPSHDGSYFMFDRGHKFQISFSRPEDGVYEFHTHAMRSVSRDSQYFLLLAHAGEIKRTQSREYYRLPVRTGIEFDKFAWNADPEHRYHGGISEPGEKLQGLLINIGGGGVLLRSSGDLRKNDLIAFDIPLPGGDDKLTDVLAKVVEIEKSDSEQHNIHVQFLNLKQSDKDMISKSIQQHKLAPDS